MTNEKLKDGGPAFPVHTVYQDCGPDGNSGPYLTETVNSGMTLRDYFATKAMAAAISSPGFKVNSSMQAIASHSYMQADAMLAAREVQS